MNIKSIALLSSMMAAGYTQAENFYVLGALGQSRFSSGGSATEGALARDANLTADGSAGVASRFDDKDLGYKLQFGYSFNQNFAVEGGYVDFGQQNYRVNFSSGDGHGKIGADCLDVAALGIVPVDGPFSVFGKVGVIDAKVDYHLAGADAGGSFADSHEKIKLSPDFGVGAMYSLNDVAALRMEVERFADLGKKSTTGESNVDLMTLGVSYRFN